MTVAHSEVMVLEEWPLTAGDGGLPHGGDYYYEPGFEMKSFLDSASTVTCADSILSYPSAFLLSRSTSSATNTTRNTRPKSNPKQTLRVHAQVQAKAQAHAHALALAIAQAQTEALTEQDFRSSFPYSHRRSASSIATFAAVHVEDSPASMDTNSKAKRTTHASKFSSQEEPDRPLQDPTATPSPATTTESIQIYFDQNPRTQPPRQFERGHNRSRALSVDDCDKQSYHTRQLRLFEQHLLPEQRGTVKAFSLRPPPPPKNKSTSKTASSNVQGSGDQPVTPAFVSSMTMTREEFDGLPPTIQRKYFSTLERLRFAQDSSLSYYSQPPPSVPAEASSQALNENSPAPGSVFAAAHSRAGVDLAELRLYANLPDKIIRRHLTEEEQLVAQRQRQSVILDAADEALFRAGKRQSYFALADEHPISPTAPPSDNIWDTNQLQDLPPSPSYDDMEGSLYESLRWLDDNEELDLRLYLDDYHINLRDEVPRPSTTHRPSFRRHLSVSKLPFGRPSVSFGRSSPSQDRDVSYSEQSAMPVRRLSRRLSLMSPSKQMTQAVPLTIDPSAAHYQDPEARMKLRVYLASPQKFDEAIEFGFPALDQVQGLEEKIVNQQQLMDEADKLCTFLDDGDDHSLAGSDGATTPDTDSPRTPELMDRPLPIHSRKASADVSSRLHMRGRPSTDYAHAPASSREMTLRMTLTRPDLRNHEEELYGWQRNMPVSRGQGQAGGLSSPTYREPTKRSIDRQPSFPIAQSHDQDHEHDHFCQCGTDGGVVKRLWNRVRRP